jgi:hypothetical protein
LRSSMKKNLLPSIDTYDRRAEGMLLSIANGNWFGNEFILYPITKSPELIVREGTTKAAYTS